MQYFPLFLDTNNCKVLVIGAGEVASRKLDLLARTQADIHVIAPEVDDDVFVYAEQGRIELTVRAVEESDIQNYDLIYLATADIELNAHYASLASKQGIWVNVVDNPSLCNFITPSIVDRGKLVVAISTAGSAPVFARQLRAKLETWLPNSIKPLFDFVAEHRLDVQRKVVEPKDRRYVWERFFELNGDKFDETTQENYQVALAGGKSYGEILLIEEGTSIEYIPMAAVPLLQKIDQIAFDITPPRALVELIRRDASRREIPSHSQLERCFEQGGRILIFSTCENIAQLKLAFPMAKHIRAGAL